MRVRILGHFAPEEDADADDPRAGEEGDVSWAALPFIYVIGVLSFGRASPRGMSKIDFRQEDEWHADDMLRHIRFERGELRFDADYVRGRMMKTDVVVRRDRTFTVETVNRGDAAGGWVKLLVEKKLPDAVDVN